MTEKRTIKRRWKPSWEYLRREHQKIQHYLDVAEVILVVLDHTGKVTLINTKGCRVLGYQREEIVGKDWFRHFLPDMIRRELRGVFRRLMAGDIEPVEYFENPVVTKKGDQRLIAWHNSYLRDRQGRISATLSSGEDITDRRRAEERLAESEERNRTILDTIIDGVITIDQQGIIESFNPGAERIFGYASEEVVGKNIKILMGKPDRYLRDYLRTGEKRIIGIGREVKGRKRDGTIFPLWLGVGELRIRGERKFVGTIRDLTDFKNMQEVVLENRNLAALGEMAATVVHEIKNPMAAIPHNLSTFVRPRSRSSGSGKTGNLHTGCGFNSREVDGLWHPSISPCSRRSSGTCSKMRWTRCRTAGRCIFISPKPMMS